MKWADVQLKDDTLNVFKPDFSCVALIAESKPKEETPYIETDSVKLAKQMKSTFNTLIMNGVSAPKACGVQCEGENLQMYIMDLPSPKLYRMGRVSRIKRFKNLDQISLFPSVISHLLHLKAVTVKVETAVLSGCNNLKCPTHDPPLNWLSNNRATVSRIPKKNKENNYR
ncbi:hypothetical protein HMPREF1544_11927 [Mucor circinelloides 1006PhL]|uniref:Uncharacterized protein n=1 Tax=Mucor circinelloides f. circinelloides (strain 1006PhL) TaxID=1220926 RepID=S2JFR3_MUCC1|nr:hypothetical protein HMPREF1544_11927 [Mucor circinelloides 1006PhL]